MNLRQVIKIQIIFLSSGLTSIVDYKRTSYNGTQRIAFLSAQNPLRVETRVTKHFYQSLQISTKHMTEYFTEERHLLPLVRQTTTECTMQFLNTSCHISIKSPNFRCRSLNFKRHLKHWSKRKKDAKRTLKIKAGKSYDSEMEWRESRQCY